MFPQQYGNDAKQDEAWRFQGGVPQVHVHPPPPFQKKNNLHLVKKKYNMNKQNFDLTFLGKFIY